MGFVDHQVVVVREKAGTRPGIGQEKRVIDHYDVALLSSGASAGQKADARPVVAAASGRTPVRACGEPSPGEALAAGEVKLANVAALGPRNPQQSLHQ